jgi:uncharacterized protein DUF6640
VILVNAHRLGRLVLSLVLVATILALFGFQWNGTHVFNPEWHPHARFHAVQLTGLATAASILGLWLLWRRSAEPRVAATVAAILPLVFWAGEFYALLVPGTDPAFDLDNPNTVDLPIGVAVYGNLLFAGLMVVLSIVGYLLAWRRPAGG